jgi:hypothetical protein
MVEAAQGRVGLLDPDAEVAALGTNQDDLFHVAAIVVLRNANGLDRCVTR